jgi:hypothetical protein
MPTSLPERRRPPEFAPSRPQIVAFGIAVVVMIGLIAGHDRFKAWVIEMRSQVVVVSTPPAAIDRRS